MKNENQFVSVPNILVECENISPKALVIYCAIKRHMNNKTLECNPRVKLIAEESGCSEKTVYNALDELIKEGFIYKISKPGHSNTYKFSEHKGFEPFSYDFLDNKELKINEKAYLIAQ